MKKPFHFQSIAMRWLFKVYLIIALAVVIVAVVLAALFSNLIFNSVQSQAVDYAQAFEALSAANAENFYDHSVAISDDFEYKNKIEQLTDLLQILSAKKLLKKKI